jgi:lactoylglutathione lyase
MMQNEPNVKQAVPFFGVTDMEQSLRFYVDGLGGKMTRHWIHEGMLRWCWLEIGSAALMLQVFYKEGVGPWVPEGKLGTGVTISFQCADAIALYHAFKAHGLAASRPFVGNGLWVTTLFDPDGYRLEFESVTDVAEETEYTEPEK